MEPHCLQYLAQISRAKDELASLEQQLHEIRLKLRHEPEHPAHLREMRSVTLEMTITLNEIEHCQERYDQCQSARIS